MRWGFIKVRYQWSEADKARKVAAVPRGSWQNKVGNMGSACNGEPGLGEIWLLMSSRWWL